MAEVATGRLILLLGGARSGKSSHAEAWARARGGRVLFVATAEGLDDEMRARIAAHRATRPSDWRTLEAPRAAGAAIADTLAAEGCECVLVDCLTLLVANALLALPETSDAAAASAAALAEVEALLAARAGTTADWLIVSNEVGMGVVPPTRLGRHFQDALGRANARLAAAADAVLLLVAGLPWRLK